MLKKTNKKGFTLIELIIVVAIMAVLVALLAPNVLKYLEKSKVGKDINTLDGIRLAIEAELMDEELCDATTGDKGIAFSNFNAQGADADLKAIYARVINDTDGAYTVIPALVSKKGLEAGTEIQVYLDGKGGIAVAAVKGGAVQSYSGEELIVKSKLSVTPTWTTASN